VQQASTGSGASLPLTPQPSVATPERGKQEAPATRYLQVKAVEVVSAAAAAAALAAAEANKSHSQLAQPRSAAVATDPAPPQSLYRMQHASTRPPSAPDAATVETKPPLTLQPQSARRPAAAAHAEMECMLERQLHEMGLGSSKRQPTSAGSQQGMHEMRAGRDHTTKPGAAGQTAARLSSARLCLSMQLNSGWRQ